MKRNKEIFTQKDGTLLFLPNVLHYVILKKFKYIFMFIDFKKFKKNYSLGVEY